MFVCTNVQECICKHMHARACLCIANVHTAVRMARAKPLAQIFSACMVGFCASACRKPKPQCMIGDGAIYIYRSMLNAPGKSIHVLAAEGRRFASYFDPHTSCCPWQPLPSLPESCLSQSWQVRCLHASRPSRLDIAPLGDENVRVFGGPDWQSRYAYCAKNSWGGCQGLGH